jgi:hypothetical protein
VLCQIALHSRHARGVEQVIVESGVLLSFTWIAWSEA